MIPEQPLFDSSGGLSVGICVAVQPSIPTDTPRSLFRGCSGLMHYSLYACVSLYISLLQENHNTGYNYSGFTYLYDGSCLTEMYAQIMKAGKHPGKGNVGWWGEKCCVCTVLFSPPGPQNNLQGCFPDYIFHHTFLWVKFSACGGVVDCKSALAHCVRCG